MATIGYVCLTRNGKTFSKCAYLESNAYLKGYGVLILQAVMENRIDTWVDQQIDFIHENLSKNIPSPYFTMDLFKRTKYSPYGTEFCPYNYEYNLETGTLTVYANGELYLTVKKGEYEKYLFYFKNSSAISDYLRYNPKTMDYDYRKNVNRIIKKSSLEELQYFFELAQKERLELENCHRALAGHFNGPTEYESSYVYSKRFRTSEYFSAGRGCRKEVPFLVEKPCMNDKWNVLVELPYARILIASGFSSEKKAVEHIRSTIKNIGVEKLLRFGEVLEKLTWFYEQNKYAELKDYISHLEKMYRENPWYTPDDRFTAEEIQSYYENNVLRKMNIS